MVTALTAPPKTEWTRMNPTTMPGRPQKTLCLASGMAWWKLTSFLREHFIFATRYLEPFICRKMNLVSSLHAAGTSHASTLHFRPDLRHFCLFASSVSTSSERARFEAHGSWQCSGLSLNQKFHSAWDVPDLKLCRPQLNQLQPKTSCETIA